jgi:hypothetical protein
MIAATKMEGERGLKDKKEKTENRRRRRIEIW